MTAEAVRMLMHEHEIILKAVRGLGDMAEVLRRGGQVDPAALRDVVGFMRNFADTCHHAKEEALLFPALVKAGMPERDGPVAVMKGEHAQARVCIGKLETAIHALAEGIADAPAQVATAIGCIEELYPQHIAKENNVLFPMAERLLRPAALDGLARDFYEAERALGEASHSYWASVAERLASAASRATPAATN